MSNALAPEFRRNAKLLRAIESIYDAAPCPERWPDTLQAIADVFDDVGAILCYGRDDGTFGAIASPSLDPMVLDAGITLKGQDFRAIRGRERGVFLERDSMTDRDLASEEEINTHPFYKFLARHGLRHFAGIAMSPDPRVEMSIAVQRALDRPEYTDAELALVAELGRHAEKSMRLSLRLMNAELSASGLRDAMARLNIGVFAIDSLKRIVFSNSLAEQFIGNGVRVSNNRLQFGPSAAREDIEAEIGRMLRGDVEALSPRPLLVERREDERPLVVYVIPVSDVNPLVQSFLTFTRAIILIIDSEAHDPPDPTIVRDLLNLTLGEARVASLVGSGISPREAAAKLGITEETARTTLKRVFAKTGVSRQTELATLLGRIALK